MEASGRRTRAGLGIITILTIGESLFAAGPPIQIPINNAGFEADLVAPGCFAVFNVTDWIVFDPNNIQGGGDVVGGLYPEGGPYFPAAPEGDHVAIVFLADQVGQGHMGLTQVLGATLQPHTRYTLTVQVGDIASGTGPPPCDVFGFFNLDGFPGYQVQLLVGGVVLAQDDNTLAMTLDDGEFDLSTVEFTTGAPPLPPGQLEVRLINLNLPGTAMEPGIEVDFDDVQLTAECLALADIDGDCAPEFADFALFAAAHAGPQAPNPGVDAQQFDSADNDDDDDVDMADLAAFQREFLAP